VQFIDKLTVELAAICPEGAPLMKQLSAPGGGGDPQVIVTLPLPSMVTEHASGKFMVLPWASGAATGAITRKASIALASAALVLRIRERIMDTPEGWRNNSQAAASSAP
jgi:hypothetical protein